MTDRMSVDAILDRYRPGDDWPGGWMDEWRVLLAQDTDAILDLAIDVAARGVLVPIHLGPDGRVWDGHHRLLAAILARRREVPVEVVGDPIGHFLVGPPRPDGSPVAHRARR